MKAFADSRSDAEEINSQLEHMASWARVLRIVFDLAFWLLIVVAVAFAIAMVAGNVADGIDLPGYLIGIVPFVGAILLGCMLLRVIAAGFGSMAKAKSPFTIDQARRLTVLGILFLAYAAFEAAVSVSPYYASIGIVSANYVASPHLFLDIKYIFASVICFCLSYVFRYGALLQWLQDETL